MVTRFNFRKVARKFLQTVQVLFFFFFVLFFAFPPVPTHITFLGALPPD